jgi:hypothetical protein
VTKEGLGVFRKLTALQSDERLAIGLIAWLALQATDIDDQLLSLLGIAQGGWALELVAMSVWAVFGGESPPIPNLAAVLSHLVHLVKPAPGDRPGRVNKTNSKEVDALLNALREVVSSTRKDNHRRDQLIAALHRAGLSYRQIASVADVSYVKVGEIVRSTEPQEITLRPLGRTYPLRYSEAVPYNQAAPFADDPTIDWTNMSPRQTVDYMARHFAGAEPVSDETLQHTLNELNGMDLPDPQIRPDWEWTVEDFRGLLQHALMRRRTVRPEEVARPFCQSALSQKHRLEHYGIDALAEVRTRWSEVMGQLLIEALRKLPPPPEVPESA